VEASIDRSLKAHYPELAKNDAVRVRVRQQLLEEFEVAARESLQQRMRAPSKELQRLMAVTAKLNDQAKADLKKHKVEPEHKMVVSLLGVLSRQLAVERASLLKARSGAKKGGTP
jgi:hypothetical protein